MSWGFNFLVDFRKDNYLIEEKTSKSSVEEIGGKKTIFKKKLNICNHSYTHGHVSSVENDGDDTL